MKLIVLCVDGLDPDYAKELGFPKLAYESKLDIPRDLYYEGVPITTLVWPSILTGRILDSEIKPAIKLDWIRLPIRKLLHNYGIKWNRKTLLLKKNIKWKSDPFNMEVENVTHKYSNIMWNFPTICPEFISAAPSKEAMLNFGRREYKVWKIITDGMCLYPYELSIAYCHLPDYLGHLKKPLESIYLDIHHQAERISKRRAVMLVSDHGCIDGKHTDHAYLGCTEPVKARNVLEVRDDIEKILNS